MVAPVGKFLVPWLLAELDAVDRLLRLRQESCNNNHNTAEFLTAQAAVLAVLLKRSQFVLREGLKLLQLF